MQHNQIFMQEQPNKHSKQKRKYNEEEPLDLQRNKKLNKTDRSKLREQKRSFE